LAGDIIFRKSTEALYPLGTLVGLYVVLKVLISLNELFSKKYFDNLSRDFKRELIKFLILEKKNLNGEEETLSSITDMTIKIFFRCVVQFFPSIFVYLLVSFYFLTGSVFFILSLGTYTLFNVLNRKKIYIDMAVSNKKKYLRPNNTADSYMENNKFQGDENDFEDSLENYFEKPLDDDNILEKNESMVDNNVENKIPMPIFIKIFFRDNKRELFFIFGNLVIFLAKGIKNISTTEVVLFSFFTFQIIILVKIVANSHYTNIKNINDIKKMLNKLSKSGVI
jgi:spermidine/putrescine-binding protein